MMKIEIDECLVSVKETTYINTITNLYFTK